MRNFWVSWYTPDASLGAFELHSPWWVSGYTLDEPSETIIVAALKATDEIDAARQVEAAYDTRPVALRWRFVDECPDDWSPFSGRWPQAAWMAWTPDSTCNCPDHGAGG